MGEPRFKLVTNRKQQLLFSEELNSVARKTITDLVVLHEAKKKRPPSDGQTTTRKLADEFLPERIPYKPKSLPVYHDNMVPKSVQPPKRPPPVPVYNHLDRDYSPMRYDKKRTKKLPYSRQETVTVEEMRRPAQTHVGVVPPRDSEAIDELRVVLEGRPPAINHEDAYLEPVARANTPVTLPPTPLLVRPDLEHVSVSQINTPRISVKPPKPAILAATGSSKPAHLAARPSPVQKPRSRLKKKLRPTTTDSIPSIMSVDVHLPQEDDHASVSSTSSVKSTKELLDEARLLSSEGKARPKRGHRKRRSDLPQTTKAEEAKEEVKVTAPEVRSVDEIIASLRNPEQNQELSDADRKIKEIMDKVMARTSAVLGDLGFSKYGTAASIHTTTFLW